MMTMHGTIMVFFVLTTAPFAASVTSCCRCRWGRGHAVPAYQHDVVLGDVASAFLCSSRHSSSRRDRRSRDGRPTRRSAPSGSSGTRTRDGQVLWAASIAIFCVGQLLGSLNFIATTLDLRTKGMTLARLPFTSGRGSSRR